MEREKKWTLESNRFDFDAMMEISPKIKTATLMVKKCVKIH
jgi:hypothetical protein